MNEYSTCFVINRKDKGGNYTNGCSKLLNEAIQIPLIFWPTAVSLVLVNSWQRKLFRNKYGWTVPALLYFNSFNNQGGVSFYCLVQWDAFRNLNPRFFCHPMQWENNHSSDGCFDLTDSFTIFEPLTPLINKLDFEVQKMVDWSVGLWRGGVKILKCGDLKP